ncbi:MAG: helix-turn-helix transcriptional regulator [Pyrinomonadaceae bacterium]|nr:helix-turn-helix transcriptional regulator [Pyrinomonadaceae bacterium]
MDNIVLANVEVEVCRGCKTETPLLRNLKKLHNAIGVAIALQNAKLSSADLRFLRRIAGLKVQEWSKRISVAGAHYARLESGDRKISAQVETLARVNFLNALKQQDPENVQLARHLETVLNLTPASETDFVIVINAENPEAPAKYLPDDSAILKEPSASYVEAKTLPFEPLANVRIVPRHSSIYHANVNQELAPCA